MPSTRFEVVPKSFSNDLGDGYIFVVGAAQESFLEFRVEADGFDRGGRAAPRGSNRAENVRQIPPGDPDFETLYRRRNDAESINRHLDGTLWLRRAHRIGNRRLSPGPFNARWT